MLEGISVGNLSAARFSATCTEGISFARQRLLRLGIVLYGTRLTFQDIEQCGTSGILIDVVMVGSTLGLVFLARRRVMLLDRDMVWPVSAGSAICGAATVLAIEPVLKAMTAQVSVAVATVVVFGTLLTFVYPLLCRMAGEWC